MAPKPKLIKVCLTNHGADPETPWAHDLGPAPGPKGSRKARLINVPFLYAKPTWGDVVVVSPVAGSLPTWDRRAVSWRQISTRIFEDGGRWAMIVDYAPKRGGDPYQALAYACAELDIVSERAWGPSRDHAGRAFMAISNALTDVAVMSRLRAAELPFRLLQVHPKPVLLRAATKPVAVARPRRKAR